MKVGENLNIESLQDKETYHEKNSSSGINVSTDLNNRGKTGISGSANKGKMDSNYQSVTNQAGIFAGEDGYDIEVGKNTDLKGAVIASKADESKNRLSTDTITYSDIENKAEYSASNKGVNVNTNKDAKINEKGITPNIGVKAQDDAKSTTKSAVALMDRKFLFIQGKTIAHYMEETGKWVSNQIDGSEAEVTNQKLIDQINTIHN